MKKEKLLTPFSRSLVMSLFLSFSFMFCGVFTAQAQNPGFEKRIYLMEELRDSFAPSSAKYDIVQDAVEYLQVLEQQYNANPNALYSNDQDPFTADKIKKTHSSILAEYSATELAEFQSISVEFATVQNPIYSKRVQWVIEANAY